MGPEPHRPVEPSTDQHAKLAALDLRPRAPSGSTMDGYLAAAPGGQWAGYHNGRVARPIATAALTLQSVPLQALVYHGAMTPAETLEVFE
jgi:hypothetical protein